jgi:MFS family permease
LPSGWEGIPYSSLVWYCVVLGIAYGGIVAMSPAMLAQFFGVEGLGELFGLLLTAFGLASVAGPPLAGLLIDRTGDLKWPPMMAVASSAAALLAVVPLRVYVVGEMRQPRRKGVATAK